MDQLSVKVQDALGAAGYEAAITKTGAQQFLRGTEKSIIRVEATEDAVRVSTLGGGMAFHKDYPAGMLERHDEDALVLMFQTIAAFA